MAISNPNYAAALAVTAVIVAAAIGIGFAVEYTGTTSSSSQTFNIHYMVVELDGNEGTLTNTFQFTSAASKPNFYTDIVVSDSAPYSTSTNYRTTTTHNFSNPVVFEISAANTAACTLSAQLTQVATGMTVTLLFYSDTACSGEPVAQKVLPNSDDTIPNYDTPYAFACNHEYGCIAKVDLDSHNYGSEKPSNLSFSITFTATAKLQES